MAPNHGAPVEGAPAAADEVEANNIEIPDTPPQQPEAQLAPEETDPINTFKKLIAAW